MTLIEQFEKESGLKYPKHDISAQANFDELYEEWLEKRVLQWIDVKDRLPENNGYDYLIFRAVDVRTIEDPGADCEFTWSIGTFKNGLFYYPGRDISYKQDEITHWMELPESPFI